MVKADLHNHLKTGSNIQGYFDRAMRKTCETLGEDGILGVINFQDQRYELFRDSGKNLVISSDGSYFYDPVNKVWAVKGQEVPTDDGHLLILGVPFEQKIPSGRTIDYTISSAQDLGGIIIVDHPFYHQGFRDRLNLIVSRLDAFEVHNGEAAFGLPFGFSPLDSRANKLSLNYYKRLIGYGLTEKVGALSSSDGHSIYEIGSSWTELNFNPHEGDFKDNLRIAIQDTNLSSVRQNTNSYLGTIGHIAALVGYKGIEKLESLKRKSN
jgi:hypothetical protein